MYFKTFSKPLRLACVRNILLILLLNRISKKTNMKSFKHKKAHTPSGDFSKMLTSTVVSLYSNTPPL